MSFLTTVSQSALITSTESAYTGTRIQLFVCFFVFARYATIATMWQPTAYALHILKGFMASQFFYISTFLFERYIFMYENFLTTSLLFEDSMKDARQRL